MTARRETFTRNRLDWSTYYRPIAEAAGKLLGAKAMLGKVCCDRPVSLDRWFSRFERKIGCGDPC
jgi:hypothetical protein